MAKIKVHSTYHERGHRGETEKTTEYTLEVEDGEVRLLKHRRVVDSYQDHVYQDERTRYVFSPEAFVDLIMRSTAAEKE